MSPLRQMRGFAHDENLLARECGKETGVIPQAKFIRGQRRVYQHIFGDPQPEFPAYRSTNL